MHVKLLFVSALIGLIYLSFTPGPTQIESSDPVARTLFDLGMSKPDHYIATTNPLDIQRGEELILTGRFTRDDGSKSDYVSKFYTCISCHNTVREDSDLTVVDQDARLNWAYENKIGYLQASTFWGIVNRKTWYNDDYILKYGDLVKKAENSLKESVQLCASVCSQGRNVTDEEMNYILSYFWSLEMRLNDLALNQSEIDSLNGDLLSNEAKVSLIESKFLSKSPATFAELPISKWDGYPYEGRPEMGRKIFEQGCMHCHRPNGESDVIFEMNSLTLKWLKRHITDNGNLSIYQIIRQGTYSEFGHKEYMPHYTMEKLSDQQLEDLRSFIEKGI